MIKKISMCDLKLNGIIKGIIIAMIVSSSSLVYMGTSPLRGIIWTIVNTIIVGAVIGYAIDKSYKIITSKNDID